MGYKVINPEQVETLHMEGRDLKWFVSKDTVGSEQLSIALMDCPAYSVVKPLHSHKGVEEVILILEGKGEAWIDGERVNFKKGDAVLFPADSKHQVRNTGDCSLITASIFAHPYAPDSYVTYDMDVFNEEDKKEGENR